MITVRPAILADAEQMAQIHVQCWRETYRGLMADEILDNLSVDGRKRHWETRLQQHLPDFVALDGKCVIGFASCGPNREAIKDYDAEVYALYLLAQYHGKGIGKQLWQACITTLQKADYKKLVVWVLKDNSSKLFYLNQGGALVAEEPISLGKYQYVHEAYGYQLA